MAIDIPNRSQTAFPAQAKLFNVDLDILSMALEGTNVVSGCEVTEQASPDMTLQVASGVVKIANVQVAVSADDVTVSTAHNTHPRLDLIVADDVGALSVVAGTAALKPEPPEVPADSVAIRMVYVPANAEEITDSLHKDRRAVVTPAATGASVEAARSTGDDTNSTTETPANDDEIFVDIEANAFLAFDMIVQFTETVNANVSLDIRVPAGATYLWHYEARRADTGAVVATAAGLTAAALNQNIIDSGAGGSYIHIWGIVDNAGNAGSAGLKWARGQAAGSVTRKSGGYMTGIDVT